MSVELAACIEQGDYGTDELKAEHGWNNVKVFLRELMLAYIWESIKKAYVT